MDRTDWSDGNFSREDLPKLIKGFIDILILASGYQSSGRLAHWDSANINKAFRWALFLEDVSFATNYFISFTELIIFQCILKF